MASNASAVSAASSDSEAVSVRYCWAAHSRSSLRAASSPARARKAPLDWRSSRAAFSTWAPDSSSRRTDTVVSLVGIELPPFLEDGCHLAQGQGDELRAHGRPRGEARQRQKRLRSVEQLSCVQGGRVRRAADRVEPQFLGRAKGAHVVQKQSPVAVLRGDANRLALARAESLQCRRSRPDRADEALGDELAKQRAARVGVRELAGHSIWDPEGEVIQQVRQQPCGDEVDPERGVKCCILLHPLILPTTQQPRNGRIWTIRSW